MAERYEENIIINKGSDNFKSESNAGNITNKTNLEESRDKEKNKEKDNEK